MSSKTPLIITVIVIIVVAAAVAAYFLAGPKPTVIETPAGEPIESPTLGGELYEKAANPISGNLPETVAPVPNPLQDVYKNPFGQ